MGLSASEHRLGCPRLMAGLGCDWDGQPMIPIYCAYHTYIRYFAEKPFFLALTAAAHVVHATHISCPN
ncbi:MAG: hypothetical protein BWY85_01656 [Firmicutes bacterium ADurb.Bin506]|nr:MAG: hypothetical protein BWY85_01656 [Firmicutes bacterium ADurb.Bin506]